MKTRSVTPIVEKGGMHFRMTSWFLVLAIGLIVVMVIYWWWVLEPKLDEEARSHAAALTTYQAKTLREAILVAEKENDHKKLVDAIDEILVVTEHSSGLPYVLGIRIELDYDVVHVSKGSLDMFRGEKECHNCFETIIPLYSLNDVQLLGMAEFRSSSYFLQTVKKDVRSKLVLLLIAMLLIFGWVWRMVSVMVRQVQESEMTVRQIFEAAPLPMTLNRGSRGEVVHANRAASQFFARDRQQLVGQSMVQHCVCKNDCQTMEYHLNAQLEIEHRELKMHDGKGDVHWVLISAHPVRILQEELWVIGFADISTLKQVQADLEMAKEEAEKASRAKGDFLAHMSHEIRTPMNAIIGMSRLAIKGITDEKNKNYLDKIRVSADTLLGILNDILDFSKIEAGKLTLEEIPFSLDDVLENLSNVVTLKAENRSLEFLYDIDVKVPRHLVGDPLRLGQILINLANNAVKFTESGEVILQVKVEQQEKNRVGLLFSVMDTGIGMSQEEIGRLFASFTQADGSITRRFGGTGLGLAICKQLVELMGGTIWVESQLGKGSSFRFRIHFGLASPILRSLPEVPDYLAHKRILVVDDHAITREILLAMLEQFHFRVDAVDSGEAALNVVQGACTAGDPYNLVLMDWKMPGLDGLETARRIRHHEGVHKTPSIMMVTAFSREGIMQQVEEVGIEGVLLKPVSYSLLFDSVMDLFGKGDVQNKSNKLLSPVQPLPKHSIERIAGARLLLVEDNTINREVALEFLADLGMKVDMAFDGEEAVAKVLADHYDLVLMDIQMPRLDGLSATLRLRQEPRLAKLPIIAMTAHAMSGDREKSLQAGMNDHITKPIDPDQLYETLLRWIAPKYVRQTGKVGMKQEMPQRPLGNEMDHADLPVVFGFDLILALQRVGNKKSLLMRLLGDFTKNYRLMPQMMLDEFAAGEKEKVHRQVHNIKSVSAYMGAIDLSEKARKLESSFINGAPDDELFQGVSQLAENLSKSLQDLMSLFPETEEIVADEYWDKEQVRAEMVRLDHYLKEDNALAEEVALAIIHSLKHKKFNQSMQDILKLIQDIEYAQARDKLAQLVMAMGEGPLKL